MTPSAGALLGAGRHACERLEERYGLRMSLGEYAYLCGQLEQLDAADGLIHSKPGEPFRVRVIVKWRVDGVQTHLVFDRIQGLIVTFLPPYRTGGSNEELGERAWVRRQVKKQRYNRRDKYKQVWK